MATNHETEVKKSLYTSLKELGLLESEASLYLTSLALGPSSIASLAEHLNIPRPNVYKAISGLEKHGLAKFSEKKRYARTFMVEPPTVVLDLLRRKRGIMSDLDQTLMVAMPKLLANYHQGETPTKIKIFHNREQWLNMFFQILDEEGEETQFFGSAKDFLKFVSWDEEYKWMDKRKERGIFIKSLLLPGEEADMLKKSDPESLREIRIVKGMSPFITAFQLFANKAIIWQPAAPLAVLVEDEYIVAMLKSMFEKLWEGAK
jgi:sugar-specific transcriptional regulator TrmB